MPKKAGGKRAAVPEHVRQATAQRLGSRDAAQPALPHGDQLSAVDDLDDNLTALEELDDLDVPNDGDNDDDGANATSAPPKPLSNGTQPPTRAYAPEAPASPAGATFEAEPQTEAAAATQGRLGKFVGRAKPSFGKRQPSSPRHTGLGPPLVESERKMQLEPEGIDDPLVSVKAHSGHEDAHDDNHMIEPPAPPSTPEEWAVWGATGVLSGLINGMLIFVFCCVFGSMIFSTNEHLSPYLLRYIAYGVSFNAATAMVSGLVAAKGSGCGAGISGPDINPAIFLAEMCAIVSETLKIVGDDAVPTACASSEATERMVELHQCADTEALLPTVLALFVVVSLVFSGIFATIGMTGSTKITQFIPAPVLGGFMGCIGYKIMKCSIEVATGGSFYECSEQLIVETTSVLEVYSLSTEFASVPLNGSYECSLLAEPTPGPENVARPCGMSKMLGTFDYGWKFLLPALPIGVPMYILKRYHIGSPRNWMPAFIIIPNVLFYMALGAEGLLDGLTPVESIVGCGKVSETCVHGNYNWFFPPNQQHDFMVPYTKWDSQMIRWDAIISAMPVLMLMAVIVSIDVLLKLAGTEKQLQVSLNMNREMLVSASGTFINAGFFGAPGYAQTKFSVINFAIVRDASNRVPAICCALFNAAMYFSGFPLINYLPRFFLSGLLIFAGAGFLVENLIDARGTLSRSEFGAVWAIVITNVFYGLLPAVIVGVILSSLIFAFKYSQTPVFKHIVTGRDYQSKGFIFFGTASKLQDRVQELFALRDEWTADVEQNAPGVTEAHAVCYLILDFASVTDLDSTGIFAFVKIFRLCKERGITLLFTAMLPDIKNKLLDKFQVVPASNYIQELDDAFEYCEERILEWAAGVRSRWYKAECIQQIHQRRMLDKALHASALTNLFPRGSLSITQMMKYCERASLPPKAVLIREGELRRELIIMQAGRIKCFTSRNTDNLLNKHAHTVTVGSFLNEEGLFMGVASAVTAVVEEEATIITLSGDSYEKMQVEDPSIALGIQAAVIKSLAISRDRLQREMRAVYEHVQHQEDSDTAETKKSSGKDSDMLKQANELLHGFHVERLDSSLVQTISDDSNARSVDAATVENPLDEHQAIGEVGGDLI